MASALPSNNACCSVCCDNVSFEALSGDATGLVAFENYTALRAYTAYANNQAVIVLGYAAKGDGMGHFFYFDSTTSDADNDASIVRPTNIAIGAAGRWLQYV